MGEINRLPIQRWREGYGLRAFVETGTFQGNGVRSAIAAGYASIFTIDISPEMQAQAKQRMGDRSVPVRWLVGDSPLVLRETLMDIPSPALFWLDAHYPERYEGGDGARLPLLDEVRAITTSPRDYSRDIIVADDMRIYGMVGPSGPLPDFLQPGQAEDQRTIEAILRHTHTVEYIMADGVYLVAKPRGGAA